MLNNFIYAKTKDLFLEKLNAGEVLDEAIVFIEDTKEIWNHGTYFDCSTVDTSDIETSIGNVDAKFANYATTESLNGAVETINNTIVENEEITAAAINDLNTRLAALEAAIANL